MSKLATLRSHLASLRRRRAILRLGNAFSLWALIQIGLLVAAFLCDLLLELHQVERGVVLALWLLVAVGSFICRVLPVLRTSETDLEMALLVERQQQIDSDLVAALQFESPNATGWGSPQLETAVIDYVADFGNGLNVFEGMPQTAFTRRMGLLTVMLLLLLGAGALFPGHLTAFFNRFLLGSMHYPTRTVIAAIYLNGQEIGPTPRSTPIRGAYGRPLRFEVDVEGVRPALGQLTLVSEQGGLRTKVDLKPQPTSKGKPTRYVAVQPRLLNSVRYQLFLGDAWTDPQLIAVIPLPVVTVELETTPPEYAKAAMPADSEQVGLRQIAVIEGSHVALRVISTNKPLKNVELRLGEDLFPMKPQDEKRQLWVVAGASSPLSPVMEPIEYIVRVVDEDGLSLEEPLKGAIRLKPDRLPRIAAEVVTRQVLPGAKPGITWGAVDDYGLARIRLVRQVLRLDGTMSETTEEVAVIPANKQPVTRMDARRHVLDLSSLKLVKGEQLRVTLEAWDYRGKSPGKMALSEPLVLTVTDVAGFLAAMVESDEQSARRLDAIIQRQLGIGESP